MKFYRQLLAVLVVVAAVVALGVAWEHSGEATWIVQPQLLDRPGPAQGEVVGPQPGVQMASGGQPGAQPGVPPGDQPIKVEVTSQRGMWLDFSDAGNLGYTVKIVIAVIASVIVLDVARRRWRRARRAAAIRDP